MAERIYYACKYTTKDQQKVECRIALALAAFDVRVQREKSAEEQGTAVSDEVKCRRRLASHMFNMTRKQEIAGPLYDLYLLRESCAYTSHMYKKLSIRQVLKFLHHHKDTTYGLEMTADLSSLFDPDNDHGDKDDSSSDTSSNSDSSDVESEDGSNPSLNNEPTKNVHVFVPVGPAEDYVNRPAMCVDLS
ncbi:hypothetical protein AeMF1_019317, partial [Aphanomyces euteiches]